MWKKIGISAVVLLLAFAGGAVLFKPSEQKPQTWPEALREYVGAPEYESVDPNKRLMTQMRTVEVAGRKFEIPKIYIGSALDAGIVQKDGLILEYVLPEFKSKGQFTDKDAYKRAFNAQRFGHMLVQPEAPRPSFDTMIENRRRHIAKEEHAGLHDGLEHYKWFLKRPEGLIYYYDIYLETNASGQIQSFIECAGAEKPGLKFPGCSHKFRDKGLLYNLHYNKKNYFSEWREQRRRAIEFVNSFETTAPMIREDQ